MLVANSDVAKINLPCPFVPAANWPGCRPVLELLPVKLGMQAPYEWAIAFDISYLESMNPSPRRWGSAMALSLSPPRPLFTLIPAGIDIQVWMHDPSNCKKLELAKAGTAHKRGQLHRATHACAVLGLQLWLSLVARAERGLVLAYLTSMQTASHWQKGPALSCAHLLSLVQSW
jgi:hypothetical protein